MERQGQYGGVGCRITLRNHYPTVDYIEEGYAFDIADVRLGDQITHINGLNLKDKSTDELLTMVRGAPNTKFQLLLSRNGKSLENHHPNGHQNRLSFLQRTLSRKHRLRKTGRI